MRQVENLKGLLGQLMPKPKPQMPELFAVETHIDQSEVRMHAIIAVQASIKQAQHTSKPKAAQTSILDPTIC